MKKIVIFTQNLDTGGVQKSASMLANFLSKIYKVTVILAEDNKEIKYNLSSFIEIYKIKTKKFDLTKEDSGLKILNYRVEQLDTILNKLEPDLIFSYEDYNNILSLSVSSKAKRVLSCRISLANVYTKSSRVHLLSPEFYFEKISTLYKEAKAVVCVSRFIREEILSISDEIKAINIYNGIDQARVLNLSQQEVNLHNNYILHVGRLHPQKGQKDLILAYHKVHTKISQKLLIIGEGSLRSELEELISRLGLSHRVFFMGNIIEPYHYMNKADFCVMPSYQEGFSNTVLEMLFTSAVVASKYDGHDEILNDYGNLFDVGDIDRLSTLMLKYANEKNTLKELKDLQKNDVASFDVEKSMTNYLHLIESIIND
ncbi:MAG: glycosyltransferase [Sulfurimonas sp.]|nr:glycosyltransferase [Sulfurimonas sp.]MDD3834159.1 glycosyltransferase [Sulfurimonas sp.]